MIFLYQILGFFALLFFAVAAPFVPRWRRGFRERLGLAAPAWGNREGELLWVHAASVGEVHAAAPLVVALLRERPAARILVSTFTVSGRLVAEDQLGKLGARVRFTLLPLDWDGIPARVLRRERPALFVLIETEIWPVLLTALRRLKVPVLLANGRISPLSFGRYHTFRRPLRSVLAAVTTALVRTTDDAQRYEALGLPSERIRVAGNLKHARGNLREGRERRDAVRIRLGVHAGRKVLIAGSIRRPENKLVLAAFRHLRKDWPELLLVLAPRHPERFDYSVLHDWHGEWVRWSQASERIPWEIAIVILDTLGELTDFYASATVACVGGAWIKCGGHNILEPAFFGVPVIFGPDFRHFDAEGRALITAGGGFLAAGAGELCSNCANLLRDEGARAEAGRKAAEVAAEFGGAVEKAVTAVREILGPPPPQPSPGGRGQGEGEVVIFRSLAP